MYEGFGKALQKQHYDDTLRIIQSVLPCFPRRTCTVCFFLFLAFLDAILMQHAVVPWGDMGAKDLQLRMSLQNSQGAWHAR